MPTPYAPLPLNGRPVLGETVTLGPVTAPVLLVKLGTGGPGTFEDILGVTRWADSSLTNVSPIFDDDGLNPSIKALFNGAARLSNAYDNSIPLDQYMMVELNCVLSSIPGSPGTFNLWILPSLDGSTFEDGDPSTIPSRPPDEIFFVRAIDTPQKLVIRDLLMPPGKFKLLLQNETGATLDNVDNDNTMLLNTYDEGNV